MRQFNKFRNTQGFLIALDRGIRFRYMITETAQKRATILTFWEHHGLEATKEAFNVSRPTLYRWANALAKRQGKLEALNNGSRAPKTRRRRIIPEAVETIILIERKRVPRLGKEKVAIFLRDAGHRVSDSTVGRMIGDLKKQGKLPKHIKLSLYARTGRLVERTTKPVKKIRRPKKYTEPCLEVDTIIRFVDGIKRYTLTAVDVQRKFAFAYGYTSHSSATATDFLDKLRTVTPFTIEAVQTDNGSEFANHFHDACLNLNITHFHTYPRSPKMNACVERFNRTLSEEFLIWHRVLMRDDLPAFNRELIDYLIWHNTKRPHWSLGLLSPMQYIVKTLSAWESQMLWTDTFA
jgi:transposase InsO family protein